jgi:imidazolonepropionase-like amidohydrolase
MIHDAARCRTADIGLVLAIKDGLLDRVPRLFYGGRVISQTGDHGDFRPGDHSLETGQYCGCSYHADQLAVIADGAGFYVAAHCHPKEAVHRAATLEVRSIEHATLIDLATAEYVAEKGAFTVPTMAVIVALV